MPKVLPFDRGARRGLKTHRAKRIALPADTVVMTAPAVRRPAAERAAIEWGIEVKALAREMEQYDQRTRERLRRVALNAIYAELEKIRRKQARDQ
jgi:hypothetical protein